MTSLPGFEAYPQWERELLVESAISPTLAAAACGVIEDEGRWEPNYALNLDIKVNWQTRPPHSFGALLAFYREDGELWQGKPLNPRIFDGDPNKYESVKGASDQIYLPPVDADTRRKVGERLGVVVPMDGSFWDWVAAHPELPIVFTEGAKKALALLSQGIIAISLYGCHGGYRTVKVARIVISRHLRDEVARFAVPGRPITLALDKDAKPETILTVAQASATFAELLQAQGCTVVSADWEPALGKGVDDLIAAHGIEAYLDCPRRNLGQTAIDKIKGAIRREKQQIIRERERQQWLASVAALAGVPEDSDRATIAGAFHTQHTLSGPSEVGTFPALALPTERRLTVLDGQKMTRKTSKALATAVHDAERSGLRGVVYAPTRVLARSLSTVLGIHTVDQFNALPQDKRPPIPWIAACPESAWKLADLNPDVMIFDEGNESCPRLQSGILGNHPQQSREVVKQQLLGCRWCIVAQDGVYRPTVATLQRWGQFAPDEVETIRRGRVATEMAIVLYQGMGGQTESWDGTALKKAPQTDFAFYTWFDGIVHALKAGQKVIIPCGSEGRLRAIHRVLRSIFPDKRGQVIDGKYTPQGVRSAFADNPSGFAESRGLDWLGYSPTFDSGVSIEGTYFDAQFEYVRAFEPATNASQRGERYRDAIRGEKLTERHVYVAQRGLPSMPPVEGFTPGYWRDLLTHPTDTEIINLARQIGGDDLVQRLDQDASEDWLELPQFMAIQAKETYFKVELLTQEWQRNGWEILPSVEDAEAAARWSVVFYDFNQGIVEQKSRALAKAKGKKSEGDEMAGAIEATKAHKWELTQTLGPDFALLSSPDFMESWVVAGDGSLQALQVRALVTMAHTQPDLWQQIRQVFALAAVARADGMDTPDLPCSPRVYELAKLLASAPGLWEMISGATPEWMNKASAILALADWSRHHAKALGRLTARSQHPTGLQFTPKTPAIKCVNKLLGMVGLETKSRRDGSNGRDYWYRPVAANDIAAKLAKSKRPHDLRRRLYRVDTQTEVLTALAGVIEAKALAPEWAAVNADLLDRYQASTTSVRKNLITEVLDGTQFLDRRGWAELRKMLTEAIQIGAAAVADLREIVLDTFGPSIWEQLSF